jgi:hypothetical protein
LPALRASAGAGVSAAQKRFLGLLPRNDTGEGLFRSFLGSRFYEAQRILLDFLWYGHVTYGNKLVSGFCYQLFWFCYQLFWFCYQIIAAAVTNAAEQAKCSAVRPD